MRAIVLPWLSQRKISPSRPLSSFHSLPQSSSRQKSTRPEALLEAQSGGRLWVALAQGVPVGFALVSMIAE